MNEAGDGESFFSDDNGIEEAAWDAPIHFVYLALWPTPDAPMPTVFKENLDIYRSANGAQRVKVWDAEQVRRLIETRHAPDVLAAYLAASPVQKSDLARYAILATHGGWYFDLDTGVDCKPPKKKSTDGKLRGAAGLAAARQATVDALHTCSNSVAALEAFVETNKRADDDQDPNDEDLLYGNVAGGGGGEINHEGSFGVNHAAGLLGDVKPTAVLFWERGRLSTSEAAFAARRLCRRGLPEWRTRLSNYAIYARKGAPVMARALNIAVERLRTAAAAKKLSGGGFSCRKPFADEEEGREYEVLFTTGPDVVTEAAAALAVGAKTVGARESPIKGNVVGPDVDTALSFAEMDGSPSEAHALVGDAGSHILLVDPGPMVLNANSWTWRGAGNAAMKQP